MVNPRLRAASCLGLLFASSASCVEGGSEVAAGADAPLADASRDTSGDGLLFDVDELPDEGCGAACAPGESCVAAACVCPATGTKCGTACVDVAGDPLNCGACGVKCNPEQYCRLNAGPNCKCRPPAVACSGTCRDRNSDPFACGACDNVCPGACAKGACVSACPTGLSGCLVTGKVACVDLQSDPGHCGACATICATDELCVAGVCSRYRPAVGCAACPCPVCAGILTKPWTCCAPLTGHKSSLCVQGSACPP